MTARPGGELFHEDETPGSSLPDLSEYFPPSTGRLTEPIPSAPPTTMPQINSPTHRQRTNPSTSLSPMEPASTGATADNGFDEFKEVERPKPGASAPSILQMMPVDKWREWIRAGLAFGLLLLLAAVVLIIVLNKSAAEAKEFLGLLLAPLVGLVGAATGFYYGGKEK